jgi:hypothetical protein
VAGFFARRFPFSFYHFLFDTKIVHLLAPSCYPHYSALSLPFNFLLLNCARCSLKENRGARNREEKVSEKQKMMRNGFFGQFNQASGRSNQLASSRAEQEVSPV